MVTLRIQPDVSEPVQTSRRPWVLIFALKGQFELRFFMRWKNVLVTFTDGHAVALEKDVL
jgi:hypothetical protein